MDIRQLKAKFSADSIADDEHEEEPRARSGDEIAALISKLDYSPEDEAVVVAVLSSASRVIRGYNEAIKGTERKPVSLLVSPDGRVELLERSPIERVVMGVDMGDKTSLSARAVIAARYDGTSEVVALDVLPARDMVHVADLGEGDSSIADLFAPATAIDKEARAIAEALRPDKPTTTRGAVLAAVRKSASVVGTLVDDLAKGCDLDTAKDSAGEAIVAAIRAVSPWAADSKPSPSLDSIAKLERWLKGDIPTSSMDKVGKELEAEGVLDPDTWAPTQVAKNMAKTYGYDISIGSSREM